MARHILRNGERAAISIAFVCLSACAAVPKLGPAPVVAPPSAYAASTSLAGDVQAAWPDIYWWHAYGDRQLDALIAEALSGNPDLAVAMARVRSADAYVEQAGAKQLPTLDASGSLGTSK
jgi:outer membrane protein TolC